MVPSHFSCLKAPPPLKSWSPPELGLQALALTDRDSLAGALERLRTRKLGLKLLMAPRSASAQRRITLIAKDRGLGNRRNCSASAEPRGELTPTMDDLYRAAQADCADRWGG